MSLKEERIERLYSHDFFKNKTGLAESIVELEEKGRIWLPNTFSVHANSYSLGQLKIILGKLHNFFFAGLETDAQYKVFMVYETIDELKMSFVNVMIANDNISKNELYNWLKEINILNE